MLLSPCEVTILDPNLTSRKTTPDIATKTSQGQASHSIARQTRITRQSEAIEHMQRAREVQEQCCQDNRLLNILASRLDRQNDLRNYRHESEAKESSKVDFDGYVVWSVRFRGKSSMSEGRT